MTDEIIRKEEAVEVIKQIIKDLSVHADIREPEVSYDELSCESSSIVDNGETLDMTSRLDLIPVSDWARLRVSKNSHFGEVLWDFQDEGSPIYKSKAKVMWGQVIAEGVAFTDMVCEPLLRLLMACLYYYLPHNNVFGFCRSYNSVLPMFRGLILVGKYLYRQRLFVDIHGNGTFLNAALLTADNIIDCINEQSNVHNKLQIAVTVKFWQDISDAEFLPLEYRLNKNSINQDVVSKLHKEKSEKSGTWMPISLEALSIVVPYCIDLIENHSGEILQAYNVLHPIFAGKDYKKHINFKWSGVISEIKELKTTLWSIDDFIAEDGMLNSSTRPALIKSIRSHIDWPIYQEKHWPRAQNTVNSTSTKNLFAIAKKLEIDVADLENEADNFVLRSKLRGKLRNHPDWSQVRELHGLPKQQLFNNLSNTEILDAAKDLGIDLYSVGDGTIPYSLVKLRHTFIGIFTTFRDACQIILCLVTGMRRSELLHLKSKKAWSVPGTDDEYRLEFDVFKTDEASQGDTVIIPIPEIAFKAYNCLDSITKESRQYGKCEYLSANITYNFGKKGNPGVINFRLTAFWEDLGIEEDIHPHMFRKTLAMFAIYRDPRNITVIKHLFSHKSLAMTLAYIVKIPGLSEDIKLAIVQHNSDLMAELLTAARNEKIGGACGIRIKEQVKSGAIAARLNDEGRESIEQYVHSLLEQGLRLLHRCPLSVICTNIHDTVVHVSPELCDCEVTNCDYAVFTEASVPALMDELRFHERWIKHPLISEDQIKFAKRKINDCLDRLVEVQGKEAVMVEFPEQYGLIA